MFVTLLYVLLKSFYVHMLTGDHARTTLQTAPNTSKHRQMSPSVASAQLRRLHFVHNSLTQESGSETNLLKV